MTSLDPSAAETVDRARQLYLGVRTKTGPHVTPELFTRDGERLWCMTSPSTLKSKRLREDPVFAALALTESSAVVMKGRAAVLDGARLSDVISQPGLAAGAVQGSTRFVLSNLAELGGAARDFALGRLGNPKQARRMVLALDVDWSTSVAPTDDVQTIAELDHDESGPVAFGCLDESGLPVVLPAVWDPDRSVVSVEAAAFEATAATVEGGVCVTRDRWTGLGPSGKQGYVLRGEGHIRDSQDGVVRIECRLDRRASWDGVKVSST